MNRILGVALASILAVGSAAASSYVNLEVSHVHPIDLTPSGQRLLAVNTPDALLEVFSVLPDGTLLPEASIPVGLEPVTVVARTETEAWVVNNLSDSISIVDLVAGLTVKTLDVGDEPTDVVFADGKAFVAISTEDRVKALDLANLDAAPTVIDLFGRDVRALTVSNDGQQVYAVVLKSGNQTSVVHSSIIFDFHNASELNAATLTNLNLGDITCWGATPAQPYPPLPDGIERNPALVDPPPSENPDDFPPNGLIVRWNREQQKWLDEAGQDWTDCLRFRLPDQDLFVIDATTLSVTETVSHLGTSLFEVSVNPADGKIYVPNTDARNFVRFEHALGLQGYVVENQLSVIDPADGAVTIIDLNEHIDRYQSPAGSPAERQASISQPGMMTWRSDGSLAYMTAVGSRKLFRVKGGCLAGSCVFGDDRTSPDAVEVGEGPSGVALLERPDPADDRLYVLNRVSHSISIVGASSMQLLDQVALHDPSSEATRSGRRFLYDAVDLSAHGDIACSTCHISGDMDGLAWDLGNPEGEMVPYDEPYDNVRFSAFSGSEPIDCEPDPPLCSGRAGFDPEKGPMATPTLRGLLEPLHWRGDRPTVLDFNRTFVELQGAPDVGPVAGKPAGLSAGDMALFGEFAREIRFPPNPYRDLDDTTPCGLRADDPDCEVLVPGMLFPGNPTEGALRYATQGTWYDGSKCKSCHFGPYGTVGGKLGGVTPEEPTSPWAASLVTGMLFLDEGHNDVKLPHLRNMYEKAGPIWPEKTWFPPTDSKSGFGYLHDGSLPDVYRFMAKVHFTLINGNEQLIRDYAAYMFHFPTGMRPAVGHQVTVAPGAPPTGSPDDETLLATLIGLGEPVGGQRHCELVASTWSADRLATFRLVGGLWLPDDAQQLPATIATLREDAEGPITFTCVPYGSGARLGGDRDEDSRLNANDCAPADPTTWNAPTTIDDLTLTRETSSADVTLSWSGQDAAIGASVRYEVIAGELPSLATDGLAAAVCAASELVQPTYEDSQPAPQDRDGYYFLVRAVNPCGAASLGNDRDALDTLECG